MERYLTRKHSRAALVSVLIFFMSLDSLAADSQGSFQFEPSLYVSIGKANFIKNDLTLFNDKLGSVVTVYSVGSQIKWNKFSIFDIFYASGQQSLQGSPALCTTYERTGDGVFSCVHESRVLDKPKFIKHHIFGIESLMTFTDGNNAFVPYFRFGNNQWYRAKLTQGDTVIVSAKQVSQYTAGFELSYKPTRYVGFFVSQKLHFYNDFIFEQDSALTPDSYVNGKTLSKEETEYLNSHRTDKKWFLDFSVHAGVTLRLH